MWRLCIHRMIVDVKPMGCSTRTVELVTSSWRKFEGGWPGWHDPVQGETEPGRRVWVGPGLRSKLERSADQNGTRNRTRDSRWSPGQIARGVSWASATAAERGALPCSSSLFRVFH